MLGQWRALFEGCGVAVGPMECVASTGNTQGLARIRAHARFCTGGLTA